MTYGSAGRDWLAAALALGAGAVALWAVARTGAGPLDIITLLVWGGPVLALAGGVVIVMRRRTVGGWLLIPAALLMSVTFGTTVLGAVLVLATLGAAASVLVRV